MHSVGAWTYTRLADLTVEELDHSWALNLTSAILALRESARRVRDGGSIVIVSSVVVAVAPARQVSYAAAKAGLEAAVRVAAKELASKRIRVNAVRPGATDTPGLRGSTSRKAIEAMSTAANTCAQTTLAGTDHHPAQHRGSRPDQAAVLDRATLPGACCAR